MLILTRNTQKQNSIKIGNDIEIKILETKGGQVRISIEAPREVSIIRSELLKQG